MLQIFTIQSLQSSTTMCVFLWHCLSPGGEQRIKQVEQSIWKFQAGIAGCRPLCHPHPSPCLARFHCWPLHSGTCIISALTQRYRTMATDQCSAWGWSSLIISICSQLPHLAWAKRFLSSCSTSFMLFAILDLTWAVTLPCLFCSGCSGTFRNICKPEAVAFGDYSKDTT